MGRTRASAKAAGTALETAVAEFLNKHVSPYIERRRQSGAKDRGDIANLRTPGGRRIVAECKDYGGRYNVGEWIREAEVERVNDGAVAGIVIAKRRGTTDPGDQIVLLTLRDLVSLLTETRPE